MGSRKNLSFVHYSFAVDVLKFFVARALSKIPPLDSSLHSCLYLLLSKGAQFGTQTSGDSIKDSLESCSIVEIAVFTLSTTIARSQRDVVQQSKLINPFRDFYFFCAEICRGCNLGVRCIFIKVPNNNPQHCNFYMMSHTSQVSWTKGLAVGRGQTKASLPPANQ